MNSVPEKFMREVILRLAPPTENVHSLYFVRSPSFTDLSGPWGSVARSIEDTDHFFLVVNFDQQSELHCLVERNGRSVHFEELFRRPHMNLAELKVIGYRSTRAAGQKIDENQKERFLRCVRQSIGWTTLIVQEWLSETPPLLAALLDAIPRLQIIYAFDPEVEHSPEFIALAKKHTERRGSKCLVLGGAFVQSASFRRALS